MKLLVVQYKLLTISEFMDNIEEWEAMELVNVIEFAYTPQWEMTRLLLMPNADKKKVKKVTDLIEFPWDKEYTPKNKEISNEQIATLKSKANEMLKYIKE